MKDLTKQEHYTNNGIEPIEIMQKNFSHDEFVGFCKGNVLKYLLRYKDKNGLEDLEKAKIYLNWLIDEYTREDLNNTFDNIFAEYEREEQEKRSCDCHCEDCENYEGCGADCKGYKVVEGDKGLGVQLTLFDCKPMEKPLADESKETELTVDDKTTSFEKYLTWKQTLDELRKGE